MSYPYDYLAINHQLPIKGGVYSNNNTQQVVVFLLLRLALYRHSGSAFNVPSRILSTLTPVIQSRQSDVKRDIEAQLKSACDRLIAHITARLTIPLTTVYVAKTPPCDDGNDLSRASAECICLYVSQRDLLLMISKQHGSPLSIR